MRRKRLLLAATLVAVGFYSNIREAEGYISNLKMTEIVDLYEVLTNKSEDDVNRPKQLIYALSFPDEQTGCTTNDNDKNA